MSPKKNPMPPHLKAVQSKGRTYYYYRMPNGSLESLGSVYQDAVEAANALTAALRQSGSLIEKVMQRINEPVNYNPRNPPMMQVIDEYRENQLKEGLARGKISKQTFEAKLYILAEYEEVLGKMQCQSVTTFELAQHLKERTGHVQLKHIPLLKKLFKYAIASGYRDTNPANELDAKDPGKRVRRRHTWEGFQAVRAASPEWLQRTMDIALYSLQRRSDLIKLHLDHIDQDQRTINILQQKTRNYSNPVYIQISAGDSLWSSVQSAIKSDIPCPYLIHCRPKRITAEIRAAKDHPFAVLPDYLSKQYKDYRDKSGAYDHLDVRERPSFHDIRALGILMYFKAGYPMDYIMALAGHALSATTEHYIAEHENPKPVAVQAGLSLAQVDMQEIDWKGIQLPPELARLVEEKD